MNPYRTWKPTASARRKSHLSGRSRQLSQNQCSPSRAPGGGRRGERQAPRPRTRLPALQPGGRERGWEGEGTKPGRPGSPPPPPPRLGGGARFLDNRARAQPSQWAGGGEERREGSEGIPPRPTTTHTQPRAGAAAAGGTSRARQPQVRLAGPCPDLPCTPAPGHSPRSERTGCRPPWSRRPAGGGRGGAGSRPWPPPRPRPGRPASLPRAGGIRRPRGSVPAPPPPAAPGAAWGSLRAPGFQARRATEISWARRRRGLETCESAEKGCARHRAGDRAAPRRSLPWRLEQALDLQFAKHHP